MTDDDQLARLLDEALASLDRAVAEPVDQLSEAAAAALRSVVRLRAALLHDERARAAPPPGAWLDAANAALSLISGVAYPAGKLDRAGLRHARTALAGLQESAADP